MTSTKFRIDDIDNERLSCSEKLTGAKRDAAKVTCSSVYKKDPESLAKSQAVQLVVDESKVSESLLAGIRQMKKLKEVWMFGVKSLDADLVNSRIECIVMVACPFVTDLTFLTQNTKIKLLKLRACTKLTSLRGIESFVKLDQFVIEGAPTTRGTLDSLRELAPCTLLRYLSLATRVKDKDSVLHLGRLTKLEYLWLNHAFKKDHYRELLEKCPKLREVSLHNGQFTREEGLTKLDW